MTIDPLDMALKVAATGLEAQSTRLRVVAENLANAQSSGETPGSDPFRRKTLTFAAEVDQLTGANMVKIQKFGFDQSSFKVEFDPGHPAADDKGYVKLPNVNVLIEMSDMREANRSYQANLQTIKQARDIISMTIELLRPS